MAGRANATNSIGIGVTQTQAGNVTPINTWVTTFPRSAGQTFTLIKTNGEIAAAGGATTDTIERDSDGAFWDSTVGVRVPCDLVTPSVLGNNMLSN